MVLILNALFLPLAVVSERKAADLILRGVAERATDRNVATFRSPKTVLEIPSVIRLLHFRHVPQRGVRWTKRGVIKRDNYTCAYCGARIGDLRGSKHLSKSDFTIDHVVPVGQGGQSTWSNTVCACVECNKRKGGRRPHEAGMRLLWEPKTPRVDYLVVSGSIPEEWKVYLRI